MFKILLTAFLAAVISSSCFGQLFPNIVSNPSFEDQVSGGGEDKFNGTHVLPWRSCGGTPDLFSGVFAPTDFQVPSNIYGTQEAFDGVSYAGLNLLIAERDYLGIALDSTMLKDTVYCLDIIHSMSDESQIGTTDSVLQAYFMETWHGGTLPNPIYGDDVIPLAFVIDRIFWKRSIKTFTLPHDADFMALGNFKTDSDILWTILYPFLTFQHLYVYIDFIQLYKRPPGLPCGVPVGIVTGEVTKPISFRPNPANDLIIVDEDFVVLNYEGDIVLQGEKGIAADVTGLSAGMYFITNLMGTTVSKLIISD